tara:strand:+ start:800 stop:1486 length:687 start_codon:yes stop_codon:yes gene_type:complete
MSRTFEEQIEGLTGLDLTSNSTPNATEITQFIQDGVIDVISKIMEYKPEEASLFSRIDYDTGSGQTVNSGQIINVTREHDDTSILRPADRIAAKDRYDAQDTKSLKYRSKYNPAYYMLDKKVYVLPTAGSSGNRGVINFIDYDIAIDEDETGTNLENFPSKYYYLVSLYAAIKTVQSKISHIAEEDEDTELVNIWTNVLTTLKNDYIEAFTVMKKAAPKQQGGQASEG